MKKLTIGISIIICSFMLTRFINPLLGWIPPFLTALLIKVIIILKNKKRENTVIDIDIEG
jgi:hypothetical protein